MKPLLILLLIVATSSPAFAANPADYDCSRGICIRKPTNYPPITQPKPKPTSGKIEMQNKAIDAGMQEARDKAE